MSGLRGLGLGLDITDIRFAGAPQKCAFLTDSLNIVDVLSILPFFVSLFFDSNFGSEPGSGSDEMLEKEKEEGAGSLEDLLQIFRIFKLARFSFGDFIYLNNDLSC